MSQLKWLTCFALTACLLLSNLPGRAADPVPAGEKTTEDQYAAVAAARTKAELAVRKAISSFHDSEDAWRSASQACDAARSSLDRALNHAVEAENAKPEDQRDPALIQRWNETRLTIGEEWEKFGNVTRPAFETAYREAAESATRENELLQNLATVEHQWKDLKGDLTPLAAMYESAAKKADEIRAAGEKAIGDIQAGQKTWEARYDAAKPAG